MADRPGGCVAVTIIDQPAPVPNDRPAVWDLVIADMKARDALGRERYGTPLQPFNGRDPLVDAYQEALDLAVYLRQAIAERDDAERARVYNDLHRQLRAAIDSAPSPSRWERFVMSRWFPWLGILAFFAAVAMIGELFSWCLS